MKRVAFAVFAALAVVLFTPGAEVAQAATYTKVVKYGPYTVPAGTNAAPGMLTQLRLAVARPCLDCYITSLTPDLVHGDGTRATMESGAMLHHAVFASQWNRDATCGNTLLGLAGERFFASGDERTAMQFPDGYGYRVRWYDSWNLLVDLMNHWSSQQSVYVQLTVTYRPPWESVKSLKPVWLDIDQCGDSEYHINAPSDDAYWNWTVNVAGDVMFAAGHVHGYGRFVEATDVSQAKLICRSNAMVDGMDPEHVMSMSTCSGLPLATLNQGETVQIHSHYEAPFPRDDVMGIMLLYVHPR